MSFNVSIDGTSTQDINFKYTTTSIVADDATFTDLTSTNATFTNLSTTTFSPTNLNVTDIVTNSIISTSETSVNSTTQNLLANNATIEDATIVSGTAALSSANIATLDSATSNITQANITNASIVGGNATLSTLNATTATITNLNNDGGINIVYNTGVSHIFNSVTNGNLHLQSNNDDILIQPKVAAGGGRVEIQGILELDNNLEIGTTQKAQIYQDANKLYIEADLGIAGNPPVGRDIILRTKTGSDLEAVTIKNGQGYGLLEVDKGRFDDVEFELNGSLVDLETTIIDIQNNSGIQFTATTPLNINNSVSPAVLSILEDATVTKDSTNMVSSGTIYTAIQALGLSTSTQYGFLAAASGGAITVGYNQLFPFNLVSGRASGTNGLSLYSLPTTAYSTTGYSYTFAYSGYYTVGFNIFMISSNTAGTSGVSLERQTAGQTGYTLIMISGSNYGENEARSMVAYFNTGDSIRLRQVSSNTGGTDSMVFNGGQWSNWFAYRNEPVNTSITQFTNLNVNELSTSYIKIYNSASIGIIAHPNNANANDYTLGIERGANTILNVENGRQMVFTSNGNQFNAYIDSAGIRLPSGKDLYVNAVSLTTSLASKQNTLTAGTNITIVNDVISALGGGTDFTAISPLSLNTTPTPDELSILTDSVPTSASTNMVNSGSIFTSLASKQGNITVVNPLTLNSATEVAVLLDSIPTASSTNMVNSGSIFTSLATKQPLITTSTNIVAFDITALADLTCSEAFLTSAQSSVSNSLTRKDYVDTQVATKQDTLIQGANITISAANVIEANGSSNGEVILLDMAGIYTPFSSVIGTLAAAGYANTGFDVAYTPITRNGIIYPCLASAGSTDGVLTKTLPNYNGTLEIQYGNNYSSSESTISLNGAIIDIATTGQISKTVTVSFTPLSVLVITEVAATILALYSIKTTETLGRIARVVKDDFSGSFNSLSVILARLSALSYSQVGINSFDSTGITTNNGFTYPSMWNGQGDGVLTKTLPSYAGTCTVIFGNNYTGGIVDVKLNGVQKATATTGETYKTISFGYSAYDTLQITEYSICKLALYSVTTVESLSYQPPSTITQKSLMSYYSNDIATTVIGTTIVNYVNNTFDTIFNSLGISFVNMPNDSLTNSTTGWLLPIGTFKVQYRYNFQESSDIPSESQNRVGIRTIAYMNGVFYKPSLAFSYIRDYRWINSSSTQADFCYVASTPTYMRLDNSLSLNNSSYGLSSAVWAGMSLLGGFSLIITKLD